MTEALKQWKAYLVGMRAKKTTTADTYCRKISRVEFALAKPVTDFTESDLERYFMDVRTLSKPNSVKVTRVAVREFWRWYSSMTGVESPARNLEVGRSEEIEYYLLTPDEVSRMILFHDVTEIIGMRNAAILCILADTGVRVGELVQLRMGDVRVTDGHYELFICRYTKTNRNRTIPFGLLTGKGLVSEVFSQYYAVMRQFLGSEDPLFPSTEGKGKSLRYVMRQMSKSQVQRMVRETVKRCGIAGRVSPHTFRHFFGTILYANSKDYERVRGRMGHASLSTTQRYVHGSDRIKPELEQNPMAGQASPHHLRGFAQHVRQMYGK